MNVPEKRECSLHENPQREERRGYASSKKQQRLKVKYRNGRRVLQGRLGRQSRLGRLRRLELRGR